MLNCPFSFILLRTEYALLSRNHRKSCRKRIGKLKQWYFVGKYFEVSVKWFIFVVEKQRSNKNIAI